MIRPGDTFLLSFGREPGHLWIVAAVSADGGECLMVNLTTLRFDADQTVILQPGEHPFIGKPSSVYYTGARIVSAAILSNAVSAGRAMPQNPVSPAVLKEIRAGFRCSDHTPQTILDWLEMTAAD